MRASLEKAHRDASTVLSGINMALTRRVLTGGPSSLRRWATELRQVADALDAVANKLHTGETDDSGS